MTDPTLKRRNTYVWWLVAIAVVSVVRLVLLVRSGEAGGAVIWIALMIVVALVVVVLAVQTGKVGKVVARVRAARPGALVVPAVSAAQMVDIARALGVPTRGLGAQGGTPIALAVLPDRIEVWGRTDEVPRWWIPRSTVRSVHVAPAVFGSRTLDAVWVMADAGAIAALPAYRPLRAQGGLVRDDLPRMVAELSA